MSKITKDDINNYLAILAAFFSYFSTRNEFVDSWKIIFPNSVCTDRQLSVIYLVAIVLILIWLNFILPFYRNTNPNKNRKEGVAEQIKNKDKPSIISKLSFLTFGIRDLILSKNNIESYDFFSKPSYWENFDLDFDPRYIYRIRRTDKRSYEYVFRKNRKPKTMFVRVTDSTNDTFGNYTEINISECWFLFALTPFYFLKKRFL